MSFFKQTISALMAFLYGIFIFIFSPSVSFDAKKFVAAVNAKDLSQLEAMMHKSIKDEHPKLRAELTAFCDAVAEAAKGGLVDYEFGRIGSSSTSGSATWNGSIVNYQFKFGNLRPTNYGVNYGDYRISIQWEQSRIGFGARESGISDVFLFRDSVFGGDGSVIYSISNLKT
jgi:hypothetical protein